MQKYEAGNYVKCNGYKAFIPSLINKNFTITDGKIISLLEKAGMYIGELNAYSKNLPSISSFLFMLAMEEATISSKIEGTKITLAEAVTPEENIAQQEIRDDQKEVACYLTALSVSFLRLTGISNVLYSPEKIKIKTYPFCTRLIKEAHAELLNNVRGKEKNPGEYRKSQNWIGGTMPSTASFVPPPHTYLPELLSDFENFWHNENLDLPILVKIAISHYQFETIHPFCDGNGRIGRLIILLQLIDSGLLELPTLYLSCYFERNRKQYYDALSLVREKNDISQWVRYFLEGVCDMSKYTVMKLKQIDNLNKECEAKIRKLKSSQVNANKLLKLLYSSIYVTVNEVAQKLNLDYQTANNLLKSFVRLEILAPSSKKRNKTYLFAKYLSLFD